MTSPIVHPNHSILPSAAAATEAARIAVEQLNARHAREARAAGEGSVTLVALADFTVVENVDEPEGRVVKAGQEFTVSLAELPRYIGRGVPKMPE